MTINIKWLVAILALPILISALPAEAQRYPKELRVATTYTTIESGILGTLLPEFESRYGIKVHLLVAGTGQALKYAESGDVDLTLTHSQLDEERMIASGHSIERRDVMVSDFVIVGPKDDPARLRGLHNPAEAFRRIAAGPYTFASRGDRSGTHQMELRIWQDAKLKPEGSWYLSVGQGMAETLAVADVKRAYCLSERGTWLAQKYRFVLDLLVVGEPRIKNQYGVMLVNPQKYSDLNTSAARQFSDWIVSAEIQRRIAAYTIGGEQVFFPNARSEVRR